MGPFILTKRMRQTIQETVTENNIVNTLTTGVIESHLRVTYADDSTYIDALAYAALQAMENEIGEKFGSVDVVAYNSEFTRSFTLPYNAVRMGTPTVKYYNESGVLTTIDAANIKKSLAGYPTLVEISRDFAPTGIAKDNAKTMEISFTVNAKTPFPKSLQQAVLLMMGHLYENREAVMGGKVVEPPLAFKYLCSQHKQPSIRQPYNPEFIVR